MASPIEWRTTRIGDAGKWLSGGTPSTSNPAYWGGDIPWISSGSLTSFRIWKSERYVTAVGLKNGTRLVEPGTILMVVRGMSLKSEFRIGIAQRPMAFGQDCKALVALPGIDAEFLAYAILARTPHILGIVDEAGHGTGRLNSDQLLDTEVNLPPWAEQRAIAGLLGAIDDKISANLLLIETADEYLSARFELALQHGHDTVRLGSIADVNAMGAKPVEGTTLRYIDIAAVGVGYYKVPELSSWDSAPGRARRAVRWGDTLWSTVRPNRRSHALNLSRDSTLVASTGLAVLSPRETGFSYLYEVTRLPAFTTYLENVAEGSTYPAVRADRFAEAPVPLLSASAREEFERFAGPLREYMHNLDEQSTILTQLRDTVLPQLMSGKLRVGSAETMLGRLL